MLFKIAFALTALFIVIAYCVDELPQGLPFFSQINSKMSIDLKFRVRGPVIPSDKIVIIDVDDKSIEHFGRWPWKRNILADGLKKIASAGPKVVSFDMVFSEPDRSPRSDLLFSKAIETINPSIPVMLGYFFYFSEDDYEELSLDWKEQLDQLYESRITAKISTSPTFPEEIPTGVGARTSIPVYANATQNHGFFDISTDDDGVIRKTHFIGKYGKNLFPSFALKTAALAQKKDIVVQFAEHGIENIFFDEEPLPVSRRGELWINYHGPKKTFPYYSFVDVYDGTISPSYLKDKIVLVGVSAKALGDLRVSPFDGAHPGVEINATILENLLHRNYLIRPQSMLLAEMTWILIMGLLLSLLFFNLSSVASTLTTVGVLLVIALGDQLLLFNKGVLSFSFIPFLHVCTVYVSSISYKYFIEEKKSRFIREAFQHYVAPSVVSEILKHPEQMTLGGEKRKLTVLFSDIRSFTSLSESISPETLTKLLNIYLTDMTNIVFDHQGMLDKYVGDELMAVFGAPLTTPTHPADACRTAVQMIQHLDGIRRGWKEQGVDHLNIGIGINTGEMIIGNMGSDKIFDYTVIGDAVNLGSRLEGINKVYGTQIVVSENTYRETKNQFFFRELDMVQVVGKKQPVHIYELKLSDPTANEKQHLSLYLEGLKLYRDQQWEKARNLFLKLQAEDPSSQVMAARCQTYLQTPPSPDWSGAFILQEK